MPPSSNLTADLKNSSSPVFEQPVSDSKKLYILFGGIKSGVGLVPFEFCRASNILNENKIFVRDFSQSWYHCGLKGISKDILGTRDFLRQRITHYRPEETILVGNSMGGFASILFASLLSNCRAIAISPQTYISSSKRKAHQDFRWKSALRKTKLKSLFRKKYYDLADISSEQTDWSVDLIVSAHSPRDFTHASNIQHLPQVRIHPFDFASHRLVKEIRNAGLLGDILNGHIPNPNHKGIIEIPHN
ncbi:alpha/beta hydrolase [Coraliomargarita sinensis]|uniref:alpha/beta hydrolase n=1 Tax=Coraliomargarita sinensis TaxID=2174842 RepID=UPI0011B41D65|nr:alpha/beta hydrolase [Coraliomargarita sinensis]